MMTPSELTAPTTAALLAWGRIHAFGGVKNSFIVVYLSGILLHYLS
jgi:hypothetical protein